MYAFWLVGGIIILILVKKLFDKRNAATAKGKSDAASSSSAAQGDDSSSSSFPSSGRDYEVFLSFRGVDTRTNFTDHLYNALVNRGIYTFRDNEGLQIGENIDQALRSAIHQSKIAIPIFSKDYASSKWCLRELAEIVECTKHRDQRQQIIVMPVFFHVDPSDVRNQTGCYKKAFQNHQKKFSQEIEGWKKALKKVGELKGWDTKNIANGHEGKLIQLIVKEVWSELRKSPLFVSDKLVGIHSHVEEMEKLLNIGSNNDRWIVGIHGLGGIGKTTIARCVYNTIHHHFEACSFIADARETFRTRGPVHLQCQLLIDILNIENPNITSVDQGINMISQRLSNKKVLIVVDDVDQDTDLNVIIGKRDWFGIGSRIIITTRDKSILNVLEVDSIYEPNEMDSHQSLLLFSKHAFRRDQPPEQYLDLSKDVIKTARGLPLALEVLGTFLVGKAESAWIDTVEKLKKIPHHKVLAKLRISYDGLDHEEKQMFLDIACFFIGMDKDILCYIWDGCGFFPKIGIEILHEKSLVKIGEDNKLRMHDQLRDLGREIVREENFANPRERSRLWFRPEVLDVLSTQRGTSKVEGLRINFEFDRRDQFSMSEDQCLMSEGFASMTKLRLLQLDYATVDGNFVHSFSELRWLSWKRCPTQFTPTNLRKLVVLDLSDSKITENWMGWNYIKEAKTLKVLNLSLCWSLTRTPDFSANLHLELLIFERCSNLVTVDESIGHLKRLVSLNMSYCKSLRCLPTSICELSSLQTLDIKYTMISRLPNSIGKLTNLRTLRANGCSSLSSLEFLSLDDNQFHSLPATVSAVSSLQTLSIRSCYSLQSLPELPSSLKSLDAFHSRLKSLPRLSNLTNLEELDLSYCENLEEIPSTIDALTRLKSLNLRGCQALRHIPVLPLGLTYLHAKECKNLKEISGFSNMRNLVWLDLNSCPRLTKIESLEGLDSLQHLDMVNCGSLKKLPKLLGLKKLTYLKLFRIGLSQIEGLEELYSLKKLIIKECLSLRKIPNLSRSKKLACIKIKGCRKLSDIEGSEEGLDSLEKLILQGCPSLTKIPNLSRSKKLACIEIKGCHELSDIEGYEEGLDSLEKLILQGCPSLTKIPNLSRSKKLACIEIKGCHELSDIEGCEEGLDSLEKLILQGCPSLTKIPNLSRSKKLACIKIRGCQLFDFEDFEEGLDSLGNLILQERSSLRKIPNLSRLKNLVCIEITCCNKLSKIEGLEGLYSLEKLIIRDCNLLRKIPKFSDSKNLAWISISFCDELSEIEGLEGLDSPEELQLHILWCHSLTKILLPKKLSKLDIRNCQKLSEIEGLEDLEAMREFSLFELDSIIRLPYLLNFKALKDLQFWTLKMLREFPSVDKLESLEILMVGYCKSIERLPDLSNLTKLRALRIHYCEKLTEIQGVDRLEILEILNIDGCISIETLPCLSNLKNLRSLSAMSCKKLIEIQGLDKLEFLMYLWIDGCISIEALPCLSNLMKLKKLSAVDCKKLTEIQGVDFNKLDVRGCISMNYNEYPIKLEISDGTFFFGL